MTHNEDGLIVSRTYNTAVQISGGISSNATIDPLLKSDDLTAKLDAGNILQFFLFLNHFYRG